MRSDCHDAIQACNANQKACRPELIAAAAIGLAAVVYLSRFSPREARVTAIPASAPRPEGETPVAEVQHNADLISRPSSALELDDVLEEAYAAISPGESVSIYQLRLRIAQRAVNEALLELDPIDLFRAVSGDERFYVGPRRMVSLAGIKPWLNPFDIVDGSAPPSIEEAS